MVDMRSRECQVKVKGRNRKGSAFQREQKESDWTGPELDQKVENQDGWKRRWHMTNQEGQSPETLKGPGSDMDI